MNKKGIMLLALALCAMLAALPALAEGTATLVYDNLPRVDFISGTSLLRISGRDGYAMTTLDGTHLTEEAYSNLSGDHGYVTAAQVNADPVNAFGLFDLEGNTLIPFEYGDVDVLSNEWALGVKLVETTADNYDYRAFIGDGYYLIETVDVYHLPEGNKLASLPRESFLDADAVNHCLNIEDRATGVVTTYDAAFNALGNPRSTYSDEFAPADYDTFRENGQSGIVDAQGNVILEPSFYMIYDYRYGFFEVSTGEKNGLVNAQGEIVIPAQYDKVKTSYYMPKVAPDWSTSGYEAAGYFAIELDGKLGYVDGFGNVTAAPTYSSSVLDNNGASALLTDLDGSLRIVAADGVETKIEGYQRVRAAEYGSGIFYTVTNENYDYGLIDWHGNVIFPCEYNDIDLSADGRYALVSISYDKAQLYELTYPAAPEAAPADEQPAAMEETAGGDSAMATMVNNAIAMLGEDAAGNKDAVVQLLKGIQTLLGSDNENVANLLGSAITLLEVDAAANASSVVMLLESTAGML